MKSPKATPVNAYPSAPADSEVIPRGLPSQVYSGPAFTDGNSHSSSIRSSDASQGVQWNDDELGDPSAGAMDPGGYDPNLSGPVRTQAIEERWAGPMTSFDANNDYLGWLQDPAQPQSRLWCCEGSEPSTLYPGSYEQSVGMPGAYSMGGTELAQAFAPDSTSPQDSMGQTQMVAGITVYPTVRR